MPSDNRIRKFIEPNEALQQTGPANSVLPAHVAIPR
jgi:hypothetical protein